MSRCPSDERLVQLLEEQLDRRDLAELERHLERCGPCQETLEELTRDRIGLGLWRPWVDSPPPGVPAGPGESPARPETPGGLAPADPAEPGRRPRAPGRGVAHGRRLRDPG